MIKKESNKKLLLIHRLKPDRGLNPESAHAQPVNLLAHILDNTHTNWPIVRSALPTH